MKFAIKNFDKIKEKHKNVNDLYNDITTKLLTKGKVLESLLGEKNV